MRHFINQWSCSTILFKYLHCRIEISQKQVSLNKALSLPKLQAGYMSESVVGQEFQGVTVDLTIPLWENKNTVKYSKVNAIAFEIIAIDNRVQLYNHLKVLHTKAIELQNSSTEYKIELQNFDNSELLRKALAKGEITLLDYILELSYYYESVNKLLELERDMNISLAELNQYL